MTVTIKAYASDTQIFVSWDGAGLVADLERCAEGSGEWEFLSGKNLFGMYADATAVPGVRYRYRVRIDGEESEPTRPVWIQPLWGWNTETQVWAANDRVNRPTFRARILDATRRVGLDPQLVESANLTVFAVTDNDVTAVPRFDPIGGLLGLRPEEVLLPNLIADEGWPDNTGFNFRHCPDIDLEPGDYAFDYELNVPGGVGAYGAPDGKKILVNFRYTNKCRRA